MGKMSDGNKLGKPPAAAPTIHMPKSQLMHGMSRANESLYLDVRGSLHKIKTSLLLTDTAFYT